MDAKLLQQAFTQATEHVLKTMAFLEAEPLPIITKSDKDLSGDVSGIIGITSPEKNLSLAITFSKAAALKMHASMLGEELEEITPDVGDAVGELANIICGQARKTLSEHGINLDASIPMVVIGENLSIHPVGASSLVLPFKIDGLPLFVEISIEK
jgi:chemotaxis protein CheX